jgi:methylthioribose-1-phosphate isomerase
MENIRLTHDEKAIRYIDQTRLPNDTVYLEAKNVEEFYEAILHLKVRGAPAIGIFAAYAMYCLSQTLCECSYEAFAIEYERLSKYLESSRPTAVNLSWALARMQNVVKNHQSLPVCEIISKLGEEAKQIQREDEEMCLAISTYGLSLLKEGDGILTHCNAGPLATSKYGTALGPLFLGNEKGMNFHVYADETRPLLQGARLTAYELHEAGIDVTLICDNMASIVMKQGRIQACFVGCDRIAANGDTANKIGTSGVAILAKHYGIPFYVLGPTSTIDLNCTTGDEIEIELRSAEEIKSKFYEKPMAPDGVKCYNPAFDVTDHELIAGIITEHGICRAPYAESLRQVVEKSRK